MTTENFTWDNVIAAMRKAVETKGEDYVYRKARPSYSYTTPDGTPSCIVGHVLADVAPKTYDAIHKEENSTGSSQLFSLVAGGSYTHRDSEGNETPVCGEIHAPTPTETELLREALDAAQQVQDGGEPWGQAYDRFLAVLGLDREDVQ